MFSGMLRKMQNYELVCFHLLCLVLPQRAYLRYGDILCICHKKYSVPLYVLAIFQHLFQCLSVMKIYSVFVAGSAQSLCFICHYAKYAVQEIGGNLQVSHLSIFTVINHLQNHFIIYLKILIFSFSFIDFVSNFKYE